MRYSPGGRLEMVNSPRGPVSALRCRLVSWWTRCTATRWIGFRPASVTVPRTDWPLAARGSRRASRHTKNRSRPHGVTPVAVRMGMKNRSLTVAARMDPVRERSAAMRSSINRFRSTCRVLLQLVRSGTRRMKILAFTAGAAKMYCGSCLRDNALAAELKRQGHDIILLPLYTPTRSDESNVSEPVVLMNGISVCLDQQAAYFRKPHRLLDSLWDARWMLKLASQTSIEVDPHLLGGMTVSMLRGEDGYQLKEIRKLSGWLSAWLRHEAPPDLVTLPNSLLIGLARPVRDALNRPVCCTLQGEEMFLSQLQEPYRTQSRELIRAKIHDVDGFVAVSRYSAGYWMREMGIPENQMHVVPLGINLEGYHAAERAPHQPFRVGYLARVAPEKGLHLLAESYLRLRREADFGGAVLEVAGYLAPEHRAQVLEVAGYLAPEHRAYLHGVERQMKDAGLGPEFHYRGELDRADRKSTRLKSSH